jgi:hypothetical protein
MSAIPFIRALQDIIRADEPTPVRKPSCRGCGGGGILPEGGSCNWCSEGNEWNGVIWGDTDSD